MSSTEAGAGQRVPVYVTLGGGTDRDGWARDFLADRRPDRAEYGLDGLDRLGFETHFRPVPTDGPLARRARPLAVRATGGVDALTLLQERRLRRSFPLAFAWDEGTSLPLAAGRRLGEPPCVSGLIWWTDNPSSRFAAYNRVSRHLVRALDGIFVNSRAQLDRLVEDYGRRAEDTWYIPYGISTPQWSAPVDVDSDRDLIVSAGNDRHRDWGLLERAVRRCRTKGAPYRVEVYTRRSITLDPDVGRATEGALAELRRAYHTAAFVVVPTRHNVHASGLTVTLEAACAARAVIACDNPGLSDYIVDGETGFLVPPGDDKALADRMMLLRHDPELAVRLGLAARQRVLAANSSAEMVGRIGELLRLVARRHGVL